ncbi:MAG: flagellar basal body-associated FliL family protein [Nitrospinaceae bacterium]|jgi:flagellar basal body-associated protein FliL|nr:flagellar basal body-associated FliL family protein [Nitrospinaceae bacterium]
MELKENIQKIIDSVFVLLSIKNFEDVYSVQGKFKLKDKITTWVNRFLVIGHVKDAYFTGLIIQ